MFMDEMKKKINKYFHSSDGVFSHAEGMFPQILIEICFTIHCLPSQMFRLQINMCMYTSDMKAYF